MFGIGSTELLIICVVALVVLGPSKLPEILRTVGKGLAEFRKISTDVKSTLDSEVRRAEDDEREKARAAKAAKEAAREEEADTLPPRRAPVAETAEVVDDDATPRPDVPQQDYDLVEEIEELPENGLADAKPKSDDGKGEKS